MGNINLQKNYSQKVKYGGFSQEDLDSYKIFFEKNLADDKGLLLKKKLMTFLHLDSTYDTDKICNFFDFDQTNQINSYKFICGMTLLRQASLSEKAKIIFNIFNSDDSNILDEREVQNFLNSIQVMLKDQNINVNMGTIHQQLKKFDTNMDNLLNLQEFTQFFIQNQDIQYYLKSLGVVTSEDLLEFIQEQKIIDEDFLSEIKLHDHVNNKTESKIRQGLTIPSEIDYIKKQKWRYLLTKQVPENFDMKSLKNEVPDCKLELQHVYGFLTAEKRNNIRYNISGEIVYFQAGVGIVMDKAKLQRFYFGHSDKILCIDVNKNNAVTGQLGFKPMICVWDTLSMETIMQVNDILIKGINHVCFSNNGQMIAASSLFENQIAVYSLEQYQKDQADYNRKSFGLVAKSGLNQSNILHMKFDPSDKFIVAGCNTDLIVFEIKQKLQLIQSNIQIQKEESKSKILCIAFLEDCVITGMSSGQLLVWKVKISVENTQLAYEVDIEASDLKAHFGPINALCTGENSIYSGGNDGFIYIWKFGSHHKLFRQQTISINDQTLDPVSLKINCICELNMMQYVVGTRGGDIIEFKSRVPKNIISGHKQKFLSGLAIDPQGKYFITAGGDGVVQKWDIENVCNMSKRQFNDIEFTCCAISYDGKFLSCGSKQGKVLNFYLPEMSQSKDTIENSSEISNLTYSKQGDLYVAVEPPVSLINVYDSEKGFAKKGGISGIPNVINFLDFSENSQTVRLVSKNQETYYFDTQTFKQQTDIFSDLKNEKWETYTTPIGWHVQGIWPNYSNGADIRSVNRNNQGLMVTGDDYGQIKIFNFPAAENDFSYNSFMGHSCPVSQVKFNNTNTHVISIGLDDCSIFQWKYTYLEEKAIPKEIIAESMKETKVSKEKIAMVKQTLIENQSQIIQNQEVSRLFTQENQLPGDERTCFNPYMQVQNMMPDDYPPPYNQFNKEPNCKLQLNYVHGYRCFQGVTNSAKFTTNNEVLFIQAGLGVTLNVKDNKQTFFTKHDDDVVSLAIHPEDKNIIATGQIASTKNSKNINLYVWNQKTGQVLANNNTFHQREINNVCFSPSGKYLLSTGRDNDNSLCIYDWKAQIVLATSRVDKNKVTGVAWSSDTEFCTVGTTHIKFWTLRGRNLTFQKGQMGSNPFVPVTSVIWFQEFWVLGYVNGKLSIFQKNLFTGKYFSGHDKSITCLHKSTDCFFSGGAEGRIIQWIQNPQSFIQNKVILLEMINMTQYLPGICTFDQSPSGEYLIGTAGAELYIIDNSEESKTSCVLQGHYDGEVWGCCTHPSAPFFATCGGDKTLRKWDQEKNKMVFGTKPFQEDIYAIDWSPNGKYIVVADHYAKVFLMDSEGLKQLDMFQTAFVQGKNQSSPWVEEIKFSPDGNLVALGCHGGQPNIQILEISSRKINNKGIIKAGLSSALITIDWTANSSAFLINTQDYFLRAYKVQTMAQDTNLNDYRNTQLATFQNKITYCTQGIFESSDYTDINSIAVSYNKKFIAIGNDNGNIQLSNYPCINGKQRRTNYQGHSSHVTRVRWGQQDTYLASTGGHDKAVIVWSVAGIEKFEEESEVLGEIKEKQKKQINSTKQDEDFGLETTRDGDEFMAVKPWLGAIKEPTNYRSLRMPNEKPNVELELKFVYGYRSKDCRNNLSYLNNDDIAFHAAGVGIVMNTKLNTQSFFRDHSDDITAFAVNLQSNMIATGQVGAKPSLYLWDCSTCQRLQKVEARFQKGINIIIFSLSGRYLAAVTIDNDHTVIIYDLKENKIVKQYQSGKELILGLAFNQDENEIIHVGVKHQSTLKFLSDEKIQNVQNSKQKISYTCAFGFSKYIISYGQGYLQTIGVANSNKEKKVHDDIIDALKVTDKFIITGSRDQNILFTNGQTLEAIRRFDLRKVITNSICKFVRAIDMKNSKLLVGTYGSEIFQLSLSETQINNNTTLTCDDQYIAGHYSPNQNWTNEVWGLAIFPKRNLILTVSDGNFLIEDATLRIWDADQNKQLEIYVFYIGQSNINIFDMEEKYRARSVAISQCESLILVGFYDGNFEALSISKDLRVTSIKKWKLAKEWISEIKFSPNKKYFAAGSHDNQIYLYQINNQKGNFKFVKIKVLSKHSSYITHLDFSQDSQYLHSTCGAYELLFWEIETGLQLTRGATQLRDEYWQTWTSILGWPVQGIWPKDSKGSDINYVDRSNLKHPEGQINKISYSLLAKGDDHGIVSIHKYPCIPKGSESVKGIVFNQVMDIPVIQRMLGGVWKISTCILLEEKIVVCFSGFAKEIDIQIQLKFNFIL